MTPFFHSRHLEVTTMMILHRSVHLYNVGITKQVSVLFFLPPRVPNMVPDSVMVNTNSTLLCVRKVGQVATTVGREAEK
jgi:hypothetical protein